MEHPLPIDSKDTSAANIASLWIGGPLSWLEQVSIASFIETGHEYTLYSYDKIENVPAGVRQVNAREIWDTEEILLHIKAKSPAIHADIFRVKMAYQTGQVWADTDIIALRQFPKNLKWFFGHERDDKVHLGNAILGLPQSSETLKKLNELFSEEYPIPPWLSQNKKKQLLVDKENGKKLKLENLAWGSTGPQALTYFAKETGEISHAQPTNTFFPVSFQQRKKLVGTEIHNDLNGIEDNKDVLCVHLYSRWMRKFTSGMPGSVPNRNSWVGNMLVKYNQVDYSKIPEKQKKNRGKNNRNIAIPKIDSQKFNEDLNTRQKTLPGGRNTSRHGKTTLITMAKDEGPYILEWVAYHHLLGFTDILVYTNDCTDGTDEILDALANIGVVTRQDNAEIGTLPPQSRALKRAMKHPLYEAADWTMLLDFDEYLSIKTEEGNVDSLIDAVKDSGASAMPITWRFFGSGRERCYQNKFTTERMTLAADDNFSKGFGVKTLFRTDEILRLGIHRPKFKGNSPENADVDMNWINGSGEPVDGKEMSWRQTRKTAGYSLAQINHYGVKSGEEYLMRRLRGDVLNNHDKYDDEYFIKYNRNEIEDTSALRINADVRKLVGSFRKFKAVREAEKLVNDRFEKKLAILRGSENYTQLLDDLKIIDSTSE